MADATDRKIFEDVFQELQYAREKWGEDFDRKNTANDWVAYINIYTGQAIKYPPTDLERFRKSMLKVAGLAISAVRNLDLLGENFPKRHYDS